MRAADRERRPGHVARLAVAVALAAVPVGAQPPGAGALHLVDAEGRTHDVPHGRAALLVCEGKRGGGETRALAPLVARLRRPENASRVDVVAVAEVAPYDFWPARHYVVAAVRERGAREGITVLLDWTDAVRRRAGLPPSPASIVLLDEHGAPLFAANAPLDVASRAELSRKLRERGVDPGE